MQATELPVPLTASERIRNPDCSRAAILHAAERLFAANGFDGTTVVEVAREAGLSRQTPRYFFGTKEHLYEGVLERVFAVAAANLTASYRSAVEAGGGRDGVVRRTIDSYVDFLVDHPNFVRLVEWEALTGARFIGRNVAHMATVTSALAEVDEEFAPASAADAAQLLLSIVGLCWAVFTHGRLLLPALGLDPDDPGFLEARKRHIADLVLDGIRRPSPPGGRT